MSDNWSVVRTDVHTFREYVKRLPDTAHKKASYCYLITRQEIERLLALKGKGHSLDGLRIYLGAEMVEGHLVPNVHVVACEHDGTFYNDFNVPVNMPPTHNVADTTIKPMAFAAAATTTGDSGSGTGSGSTGVTAPCPNFCGKTNILNS